MTSGLSYYQWDFKNSSYSLSMRGGIWMFATARRTNIPPRKDGLEFKIMKNQCRYTYQSPIIGQFLKNWTISNFKNFLTLNSCNYRAVINHVTSNLWHMTAKWWQYVVITLHQHIYIASETYKKSQSPLKNLNNVLDHASLWEEQWLLPRSHSWPLAHHTPSLVFIELMILRTNLAFLDAFRR